MEMKDGDGGVGEKEKKNLFFLVYGCRCTRAGRSPQGRWCLSGRSQWPGAFLLRSAGERAIAAASLDLAAYSRAHRPR